MTILSKKNAVAKITSTGTMAILAKSETTHDGHLADDFKIANGEWKNRNRE